MVGDMVNIQKQANEVVAMGQSGKYTNGEMVVFKDAFIVASRKKQVRGT